jgi:predicted short-subunit dehydrogenase-like oxidoreductase (DUF2520 family)
MNVVLIGAGNVASYLGPVLKKKGHTIVQVFSRSRKSGKTLASLLNCEHTTLAGKILTTADIYIVALRDEVIASFLDSLPFTPKLIVHTSGSTGMDVFPEKMKDHGIIYPVQSFSKSRKKYPDKIPICMQASNDKSQKKIKKFSKTISPVVVEMNSSDRFHVHLAAVFANNFANYLFLQAEKILVSKKLPFDLLKPLILETAMKVQEFAPAEMQTGPAKRGDATIINRHLTMLKNHPDCKHIYKLISGCIEKDLGPRL